MDGRKSAHGGRRVRAGTGNMRAGTAPRDGREKAIEDGRKMSERETNGQKTIEWRTVGQETVGLQIDELQVVEQQIDEQEAVGQQTTERQADGQKNIGQRRVVRQGIEFRTFKRQGIEFRTCKRRAVNGDGTAVRRKRKGRLAKAAIYFVLAVMSLIWILPVVGIVVESSAAHGMIPSSGRFRADGGWIITSGCFARRSL